MQNCTTALNWLHVLRSNPVVGATERLALLPPDRRSTSFRQRTGAGQNRWTAITNQAVSRLDHRSARDYNFRPRRSALSETKSVALIHRCYRHDPARIPVSQMSSATTAVASTSLYMNSIGTKISREAGTSGGKPMATNNCLALHPRSLSSSRNGLITQSRTTDGRPLFFLIPNGPWRQHLIYQDHTADTWQICLDLTHPGPKTSTGLRPIG